VVTVNHSLRSGEREVESFHIGLKDAMRLVVKMNGAGEHQKAHGTLGLSPRVGDGRWRLSTYCSDEAW
jgi:hypothetical protein